jgi:hypothetical protein
MSDPSTGSGQALHESLSRRRSFFAEAFHVARVRTQVFWELTCRGDDSSGLGELVSRVMRALTPEITLQGFADQFRLGGPFGA